MSGRLGIDYAWGGPPPLQALRRARVQFVGRYLSLDPSKDLTAAERAAYKAAGIEVKPIWETTAERARQGEQAGIQDAKRAIFELRSLGVLDLPPVYLAVDFPATGPGVEAYFRGARSILGEHTGVYGGYHAIRYLFDHGLVSHGWQTYAWSSGQWDPRARVRQYSNGHQLAGVDVDYDIELPAITQGPYVPSDEHNWIREYDRLQHDQRAPIRRAQLRRLMTLRRKLIWRLAHKTKTGWQTHNREARWRALVDRTE